MQLHSRRRWVAADQGVRAPSACMQSLRVPTRIRVCTCAAFAHGGGVCVCACVAACACACAFQPARTHTFNGQLHTTVHGRHAKPYRRGFFCTCASLILCLHCRPHSIARSRQQNWLNSQPLPGKLSDCHSAHSQQLRCLLPPCCNPHTLTAVLPECRVPRAFGDQDGVLHGAGRSAVV